MPNSEPVEYRGYKITPLREGLYGGYAASALKIDQTGTYRSMNVRRYQGRGAKKTAIEAMEREIDRVLAKIAAIAAEEERNDA